MPNYFALLQNFVFLLQVKESQSLEELRIALKDPLVKEILDNLGIIPDLHVSTLEDKEKFGNIVVRFILYDSVVFLIA